MSSPAPVPTKNDVPVPFTSRVLPASIWVVWYWAGTALVFAAYWRVATVKSVSTLLVKLTRSPCVVAEPMPPKTTASPATGSPVPPAPDQLAVDDQLPGGVALF